MRYEELEHLAELMMTGDKDHLALVCQLIKRQPKSAKLDLLDIFVLKCLLAAEKKLKDAGEDLYQRREQNNKKHISAILVSSYLSVEFWYVDTATTILQGDNGEVVQEENIHRFNFSIQMWPFEKPRFMTLVTFEANDRVTPYSLCIRESEGDLYGIYQKLTDMRAFDHRKYYVSIAAHSIRVSLEYYSVFHHVFKYLEGKKLPFL